MVFCGSGGTATVPPVGAGAGEEAAGGGLSWPTSGWLAVVVVFLVFFFVVVGAALGVAWAWSFFMQALREVLLFSVWQ